MEAIISFLLNALPEVALALVFGCVAWNLSKRLSHIDNHFANIDTNLNDLQDSIGNVKKDLQDNIGNVKTELGQVRESIQNDINQIKIDMNDIQLFITSKFPTAVNTFSSKHSPLVLNEMGIKLYEECGGKTFLDANQILLFKKLDEKKPKTALDVELGAKDVLFSLINDDIFNGIKVWVYNSPSWKVNDKDYVISLGDVCFVLSIPLRDRYLELHPEIAK